MTTAALSRIHSIYTAFAACLLCAASHGQSLPATIDLALYDIENQELSREVVDLSVVNLEHLQVQKQELLFKEINSLNSLHLAASKPTTLSESFLPVMQNLKSLSLENLVLSRSLFSACFNAGLSQLQLTGIHIPPDVHRIEIGRFDSLSIIGCDFKLLIHVKADQIVDRLAITYPTGLDLEMSNGAAVKELSLLARGFHVKGKLPLRAKCSLLRLHGFDLSVLDIRGLETHAIVIEKSILESDFELCGFSDSPLINVAFKNCNFIRR